MRMRTLPQAIAIVTAEDPGTAITLPALRRMVKQGQIPVAMMGSKVLIDVDRLPEYFRSVEEVKNPSRPSYPGQMRPIKE